MRPYLDFNKEGFGLLIVGWNYAHNKFKINRVSYINKVFNCRINGRWMDS